MHHRVEADYNMTSTGDSTGICSVRNRSLYDHTALFCHFISTKTTQELFLANKSEPRERTERREVSGLGGVCVFNRLQNSNIVPGNRFPFLNFICNLLETHFQATLVELPFFHDLCARRSAFQARKRRRCSAPQRLIEEHLFEDGA